MHKHRLGILIASGAGMLGTFLPWATVPFLGSISGTKGDGWITFVLFGIALGLTLIGDKKTILTGGPFVLALILGAAAGLFGLWKIIDFHSSIGEASALVSLGIGLYLIVLAGLVVVILGLSLKKE